MKKESKDWITLNAENAEGRPAAYIFDLGFTTIRVYHVSGLSGQAPGWYWRFCAHFSKKPFESPDEAQHAAVHEAYRMMSGATGRLTRLL